MMGRSALTLAAAVFLLGAAPAGGDVSFRAGVYTQAQADRGLHAYVKTCAACHGDMFNGSESGPPLSDDAFLGRWKGKSLADLYTKMSKTMPPPPDQPGKLSPQDYADIVAAVLSINEIPTGQKELPADPAALAAIKM
jgi:mono/diheme cytochrome c family protein